MMQVFVVCVENKPGVLNRVASLFRRRGFNIDSLTVGRTERPGVSRMTIAVETDEQGARRIEMNLRRLIPVRRVDNITAVPMITRDLAMIKVAVAAAERAHVMQLADAYRARIVDVSTEALVVEVTGAEEKVDSLIDVLRPYGLLEVVRTGRVAMARGAVRNARSAASPAGGASVIDNASNGSV